MTFNSSNIFLIVIDSNLFLYIRVIFSLLKLIFKVRQKKKINFKVTFTKLETN
jgi:hypothetical protein